jgi:hypothetical protein
MKYSYIILYYISNLINKLVLIRLNRFRESIFNIIILYIFFNINYFII